LVFTIVDLSVGGAATTVITSRAGPSYPSGGLSSLLVAVVVEFAEFAECRVTYVVRLCACGLMAPGAGWE
jgi:hypothetical protein